MRYLAILMLPLALASGQEVTNSLGMKLRYIPEGNFLMGMEGGERFRVYEDVFYSDHASYALGDERPAHPVFITKHFYMGATEVTRGQFAAFVQAASYVTTAEKNGGAVGWHYEPDSRGRVRRPFAKKPEFTWKAPGFDQTDNHPVVGVSWEDAQAFCAWLSQKEGVKYRLPTEAEWEYTCKAGKESYFHWGDTHIGNYQRFAKVADSSLEKAHPGVAGPQWYFDVQGDGTVFTAPVGAYQPNAFGLSEMHGNVWEWCQDIYNDTVYNRAKRDKNSGLLPNIFDPLNETERWNHYEGFEWRVIRGGSWAVSPIICRASARSYLDQKEGTAYTGFRVVREAPAQALATAKAKLDAMEATRAEFVGSENIALDGRGMPSEKIRLRADKPTDAQVAKFPLIPRVTALEMNGNQRVTPGILANIAKMQELEHLRIWNATGPPEG